MKSLTYLEQLANSPSVGLLSDFEQFRQSILGSPFVCIVFYEHENCVPRLYDWFLDHYIETHTVKINRSCRSIEMSSQHQFIVIRLIHWTNANALMGCHDIDFIVFHMHQLLQAIRRLLMVTRKYGNLEDVHCRTKPK